MWDYIAQPGAAMLSATRNIPRVVGCTAPPPPTDQGNGKERSVVRPMGTAAYGGKGQGKGKGRGEGRLGQGGRGRSKGGEKPMGTTAYGGKGSKGRAANGDRPVGAASCRRDHHTMASCQNPPPPPALWDTDACARLVPSGAKQKCKAKVKE